MNLRRSIRRGTSVAVGGAIGAAQPVIGLARRPVSEIVVSPVRPAEFVAIASGLHITVVETNPVHKQQRVRKPSE